MSGLLPTGSTSPAAPLPSLLQELRPVIHGARRPFRVDGEARTGECLSSLGLGTASFGVVVGEQDNALDTHWDLDLMETLSAHAGPCLDAGK